MDQLGSLECLIASESTIRPYQSDDVQSIYQYELSNASLETPHLNLGINHLLAYYPLNGDASDRSGNGFDATPINNLEWFDDATRGPVLKLKAGGYTSKSGSHIKLPDLPIQGYTPTIYSLTKGQGDSGNASFTIEGDQLKTAAEFNYEAKNEYTIRVKGTDSGGLSIEKTFTLNVTDGPTLHLRYFSATAQLMRTRRRSATVGNLGAVDEDAGEKHTYRLVDIPVDPDPENPNAEIIPGDNSFFAISGTTLKTNAILDFEAKSAYTINVEVTDKDKRTYQQLMVIGVNDTNDAPTGLTLDRSEVAEGLAKGTEVGTLLPIDPDAGDTHTYRISGGKDASFFTIVDNKLVTNAVFDREEKQLLDVDVTVTDSGKETYIATFEITVLDVNDAPTDITLDNDTIAENQPEDTLVGKFTLVDPT